MWEHLKDHWVIWAVALLINVLLIRSIIRNAKRMGPARVIGAAFGGLLSPSGGLFGRLESAYKKGAAEKKRVEAWAIREIVAETLVVWAVAAGLSFVL